MKKLFTAGLLLLASLAAMAQSANYKPGKVAFCPVYDTAFSGYPQDVTDLMQNKLTQIVMLNGVGSFSEQYVLTAKIAVEDKQVTATVPAQYIMKLSVQLQAVDVNAQILVGELTLPLTGVDKTENRAIMAAIRQIAPKSAQMQTFITEASDAVVAAYNRNMDSSLENARLLEDSGAYEDALALLAQIPENVDRIEEVRALSGQVAQKKLKRDNAQAAVAAANAKAKAEADEEARRREEDRLLQQQMMESMQKKAEASKKGEIVGKVKKWFLGSLS